MHENLEEFDGQNQTLIDYFAIIGPDHKQLQNLIHELSQNKHERGREYDLLRDSQINTEKQMQNWKHSKGKQRVLIPTVLARFPKQDRKETQFPQCVDDYFFERLEPVYSREQMVLQQQKDPENYEAVELSDNLGRQRYVTTHLFFEDLASIQPCLEELKDEAEKVKPIEKDRYFIRKGFCLVTSLYPASRELNRLNIFLRKLCQSPSMYAPFESYLSRVLFSIPLPSRRYPVTLQL